MTTHAKVNHLSPSEELIKAPGSIIYEEVPFSHSICGVPEHLPWASLSLSLDLRCPELDMLLLRF